MKAQYVPLLRDQILCRAAGVMQVNGTYFSFSNNVFAYIYKFMYKEYGALLPPPQAKGTGSSYPFVPLVLAPLTGWSLDNFS